MGEMALHSVLHRPFRVIVGINLATMNFAIVFGPPVIQNGGHRKAWGTPRCQKSTTTGVCSVTRPSQRPASVDVNGFQPIIKLAGTTVASSFFNLGLDHRCGPAPTMRSTSLPIADKEHVGMPWHAILMATRGVSSVLTLGDDDLCHRTRGQRFQDRRHRAARPHPGAQEIQR